ncbi:hypothetical protein BDW02DRAFT_600108 [Decorospora gaudefroyi]|uniref:Zn(2)-C6 fungal-type domain-containing protein n=1 Tax=Decorospora gaudefroyi TaxID=184978 RepID=A0A6A5K613_9PLEO|nr:hypothetical protein BDW02DRAFT_600108 [Decorospora gaudefroyi]
MQDDRRPEPSSSAGPSRSQFKVAIPRLPARHAPPPTTTKSRQRDRVQRACRNCHKRKIKCSGGLPRCNYCEKTDKSCVYERPRRDRLATARDRNQHLVAILRDLSSRVSDDDRRRIDDALQDSDDHVESPTSLSSSKTSIAQQYEQHSRLHPFPSSSTHGPHAAETSPTSDRSSLPRLDGVVSEAESADDDTAENPEVVEAGFLGQISEVQWLQSLRSRVQAAETVFVGLTDISPHVSHPASPIFHASPMSLSSSPMQQVALINYYLDDAGIKLAECGNVFELPPEHTARLLFQCYSRTVQSSFPILPATLENQLHQYYNLVCNGQSIHCPQKWFALVNLVFAIGAKFSHLVQADWRADELDHVIYLSRAFQLLSMNDTVVVLSTPDLSTTQATGLFAFYYMVVGHVNRAWVMVGLAIRAAFSLGLHVQEPDDSIPPARQQNMVRTWWSLHALESLLSSITGRPSIIPNEDITTAPPSTTSNDPSQGGPGSATDPAFLNANSSLNLLTQQIISNLYTQRRATPSWDYLQQVIVSLVGDLDKWAVDFTSQFHPDLCSPTYEQQREKLLLKMQYYRLKILTTRPSLRRIERCYEAGTDDFTSLDRSVAETCIQAAQDVTLLVASETNVKTLYEKGPWWSMVHNVMQALAVLMNAIACPDHFRESLKGSIHCVKQLVGWLRAMGETSMVAGRAYQVLYSIVKTSKPYVWDAVAEVFPDEVAMVLQQPASGQVDPRYLSWPAKDQLSEALFQYELDGFGNYHFHML